MRHGRGTARARHDGRAIPPCGVAISHGDMGRDNNTPRHKKGTATASLVLNLIWDNTAKEEGFSYQGVTLALKQIDRLCRLPTESFP